MEYFDSHYFEHSFDGCDSPADVVGGTDKAYVPNVTYLPVQEPTPVGTPTNEAPQAAILVSVSTAFHPGANLDPLSPDIILVSSDNVYFHVHRHILLGASESGFNSLLRFNPGSPLNGESLVIPTEELAVVLNVVLHTLYEKPCAHYSPSFVTLTAAVDALKKYGVPTHRYVVPSTPLYSLILAQAPMHPVEGYALAAAHDLHDLAVSISPHLLSFNLSALSDDMAVKIGPIYLMRLYRLHYERMSLIKELLLSPPYPHPPTDSCGFVEQKRLTRAWALASAYLAWDARPDLSASLIQSALGPLGEQLSCMQCKDGLRGRIRDLIVQWSIKKRTI